MKHKRLLCCLTAALLLAGCGTADEEHSVVVYAMDTVMELKAYGKNAETALRQAEKELMSLDEKLRRGDESSEIYKINSGGAEVSPETAELIRRGIEIGRSTGGAFDLTIAPVMDLWGFYGGNYRVPDQSEIDRALEKVDYGNVSVDGNYVSVNNGAEIDLGGIAKGCASERVMEIFRENSVTSGIVSLGGNVRALGNKPGGEKWKIAIQNPDGEGYCGTLEVSDAAAVTSGGYQRKFERGGETYHHIIDPETGRSAKSGVKSVTVVSADAALADALSTALFVMGLEKGTQYWRETGGFGVVFVSDNNKIYVTEDIADSFRSDWEFEVLQR